MNRKQLDEKIAREMEAETEWITEFMDKIDEQLIYNMKYNRHTRIYGVGKFYTEKHGDTRHLKFSRKGRLFCHSPRMIEILSEECDAEEDLIIEFLETLSDIINNMPIGQTIPLGEIGKLSKKQDIEFTYKYKTAKEIRQWWKSKWKRYNQNRKRLSKAAWGRLDLT